MKECVCVPVAAGSGGGTDRGGRGSAVWMLAADGSSDPASPPPPLTAPPSDTAQLLISELSPFPKQLKAAHINAQSLRGHIDDISAIFRTQSFDIISISESSLKPSIPSVEVSLSGYILHRNDRLNKGSGGVAVYTKQNLRVKFLDASSQEYSARPEYLFLEIGLSGSDALLLGVCYRPPKIGHLSDFENVLLRLMPSYSHVLIMGDMNTDLLMKTPNYDYNQLTTMFDCCNMSIVPLDATHHTAESHTLLDLIVVNELKDIFHKGQLPIPAVSKHNPIFCVLSYKTPKPTERFLRYRDFRRLNEDTFLKDVVQAPWHSIETQPTVNEMVDTLNSLILSLFDKHASIVEKRVNKRHRVPWLTQDVFILMAQRDSVYRKARKTGDVVAMDQYRRLRNRVKQSLRNARLRYVNTLFTNRKQPSNVLWRNIKKVGIWQAALSSSSPSSFE
uniref:Endonuclease/exonuclease/phosphatase domain-containing protein n=1 Tax=Graphocephala atropunctata TaxID=36148 RepID=A0A1B6LXE9_9HEMI